MPHTVLSIGSGSDYDQHFKLNLSATFTSDAHASISCHGHILATVFSLVWMNIV